MIEAIIRLERMIPLGFCGSRPSRDVVAIHRTMGVVTALDRALTFPLSRTGFRMSGSWPYLLMNCWEERNW